MATTVGTWMHKRWQRRQFWSEYCRYEDIQTDGKKNKQIKMHRWTVKMNRLID